MTSPTTRPRFQSPPVVEVVLSAQFKPLKALGVPHLGLLWDRFRDRFPRYEHHPPLSHAIERLGARPRQPQFEMQLVSGSALTPRLWMLNEAGSQLLQVQEDRFVRNWRRYEDRQLVYPEYAERLRPDFHEDLERFSKFVAAEGLGELEFDQAEVTYINHIEQHDVWKSHHDFSRVLRDVNVDYSALTGFPLENVGLRTRHHIQSGTGEFAGRLYVDFDSAFVRGEDGDPSAPYRPIFVLQLTARGRPLGEGPAGLFSFLDMGHDAIVSTFDKITTEAMHRVWEKVS